jgi:hypothetical protein
MAEDQERIRPEKGILASIQSNWERWLTAWKRLQQTWEHLGALGTNLGVPATGLEAPRITGEQSDKHTIFFGNAASVPSNHNYYISFNDF